MDEFWAAENLQVIRTLMERSALYRRALAPIMSVAGLVGTVAAVIPCFIKLDSNRAFTSFWLAVSLVTVAMALILVRRQAGQDREPFWSVPTRRVSQALLPSFMAGCLLGLLLLVYGDRLPPLAWCMPPLWMIFYGCGLHAAGSFTRQGIRHFGWLFLSAGCLALALLVARPSWQRTDVAHEIMGVFFGLVHLACGAYLYYTERKRNAA